MVVQYNNKEDKFKIICLSCGSEDVSVREDIAYDYDDVVDIYTKIR